MGSSSPTGCSRCSRSASRRQGARRGGRRRSPRAPKEARSEPRNGHPPRRPDRGDLFHPRPARPHGAEDRPLRQPPRRRRHGARHRDHLCHQRADPLPADRRGNGRSASVIGGPRGTPREDDRHAADGGGVQRGRRRGGRADRPGHVPPGPGRLPRRLPGGRGPLGRRHRLRLVLGQLHRLRQAPRAHDRAGQSPTPASRSGTASSACAILGLAVTVCVDRFNWLVADHPRARAGLRRRLRPAGRRGGRARPDLAVELVHRSRCGGERLRAALGRARRRRHARRCLGHAAHPDDEPGHGTLAPEHPLQRLRLGHHGHRRRRGRHDQERPVRERRGRRHPACRTRTR